MIIGFILIISTGQNTSTKKDHLESLTPCGSIAPAECFEIFSEDIIVFQVDTDDTEDTEVQPTVITARFKLDKSQ